MFWAIVETIEELTDVITVVATVVIELEYVVVLNPTESEIVPGFTPTCVLFPESVTR